MQFIYWLLAILIAFSAAFLVFRADRRRAVPFPWITSTLRGLLVLSVLLLVLVPDLVINKHITEQPVIVILQDRSSSAGVAVAGDSTIYRQNMEALSARLSDKYRVIRWGFGDDIHQDSFYHFDRTSTNISAALTGAEEFYGMQNLGGIILATDGRFNVGINPIYRQTAFQGALYTIALGDSTRQKDLRISRTFANRTATINSSFEIQADIIAELCAGYSKGIVLMEGNEVISNLPISVSDNRFDRSVSFSVKATKPGLHHYVVVLPELANEVNTANNKRDVFVEVTDERRKILLAAASPHPDINSLRDAFNSLAGYEVTVCSAEKFPASLKDYDAVILHGLPSLRYRISNILQAANKPLWFILTTQSDIAAINGLNQLTHTTIAPAAAHDIQLNFNTPFNAFTVPQRIQSVTDKMPPLVAATSNIIAAPGAGILFTQRTPAGTMPAWLMQHGAVPTAILAGEGIWRWRMYEYKNFDDHAVVDECIRQTVSFLCANTGSRPFNVIMSKHIISDQESVTMNAILLNANNEPINTPDVSVTITDSAQNSEQYTFERSGTGYNLNIGIHAGGRYNYVAKTTYNGKETTAAGAFVVAPTPLEFMETGSDYSMLYNLSKKFNSTFTTVPGIPLLYDSIIANKNIKPLIKSNSETVPLIARKWYFLIILVVAVAEWLLRKYWLAQ
jgi:hypothetical protein